MLLARYAPVSSQRYKKLAQTAKSIDKIIQWIPAQLFGIWTTFVIGMSVGKAQLNRYYFWDWTDWLIGIIGILFITIILNLLKVKIKEFPFKGEKYSLRDRGYHAFMLLTLMIGGFALNAGFNSAIDMIIYLLPYVAIFMIYTIGVDLKSNIILKESNKYIKSVTSIILFAVAIIIGLFNNDPLLSTASMVSLPFVIVLLFGKHFRYLERAKFYPIFIFAMFVVSREAWFLIPLLLLFFILRSYNYLRYQKVYPTFGVTDDQS